MSNIAIRFYEGKAIANTVPQEEINEFLNSKSYLEDADIFLWPKDKHLIKKYVDGLLRNSCYFWAYANSSSNVFKELLPEIYKVK